MRHLDTAFKGQRFPAPRHIEDGQSLRFRLRLLENARDKPRHVIHVHELDPVIQIVLPCRQHAGQPLARACSCGRPVAHSAWRAPKSAHHIRLHAGPGVNMRTQHVHTAASQCGRTAVAPLCRIPSCAWRTARYGRPADVPRSPARSSPTRKPKRCWEKQISG